MNKHTDSLIDEKMRILANLTRHFLESLYLPHASNHELTQLQLFILKIVQSSGAATGSQVARLLGITRAAASQNIEYLVNKNLVIRQEGIYDRRSKMIILTNEGQKAIEKFDQICQYNRQFILSTFSEEEKDQLNKLLNKYIINSLEIDKNLALYCLECGKEYDKGCPIKKHTKICNFAIVDKGTEKK